MSARTSTSPRPMALSPGPSPRRAPKSSSPAPATATTSRIRKTTISRTAKPTYHPLRLSKSFAHHRHIITKLHEAQILSLLEENNVLKNWWAINMQTRPDIANHHPPCPSSSSDPHANNVAAASHQWRKSEAYFREPIRQAQALIDHEYRLLRPEFDAMLELRNDQYKRTIRDLAAARVQLGAANAARSRDLDMLGEAVAMQEREARQNEVLNERLDEVEAERDELAASVEVLKQFDGVQGMSEKLKMAEDALAVAGAKLDIAQRDSTLERIRRALVDRRLR